MRLDVGLLMRVSLGSYSSICLMSSCFRCRTYSRLFYWSHPFCKRISDSWRINARSSVSSVASKYRRLRYHNFFIQNFETHGTTKRESLSACVVNRTVRGIRNPNRIKTKTNVCWCAKKVERFLDLGLQNSRFLVAMLCVWNPGGIERTRTFPRKKWSVIWHLAGRTFGRLFPAGQIFNNFTRMIYLNFNFKIKSRSRMVTYVLAKYFKSIWSGNKRRQ